MSGNPVRKEDLYEQGWRLNNLYKIVGKDGKEIPFRFNWAQEEFFESIWFNSIVLKARQLGFSTVIDLMALDNCLFVPNYSALIIAHKTDAAEGLFEGNIKFPYEHLPESIRNTVGAERASVRNYKFSNGSDIKVDTSGRSGTNQFLHISEFGKICAQYPHKAREIITGSLETVGQGQIVVIESTAEGNEGAFYDYCQTARALEESGKKLTLQDFKFFFFPWWRHPDYRMQPQGVVITDKDRSYFDKIEAEVGNKIDAWQRAWYVKKREKLGEDMTREYPSTPDEAFQVSIEGVYFAQQLAQARKEGRIGAFPLQPSVPIHTFWDLGVHDYTAIWLMQVIGGKHRFGGYIEGEGVALNYYVDQLFEYRKRGFTFGTHFLPHDGRNRSLQTGKRLYEVAMELGLTPLEIIDTPDLAAGIQQARTFMAVCEFDETACATGIKRLQNFRKQWSETLACYTNTPRHDEHSHGASAYRIAAQAQDHLLRIRYSGGPAKPPPRSKGWT